MLTLLLACTPDPGSKDSGVADSAADTGDTAATSAFDTGCFAQVMQSQEVCECSTVVVDWSALTHDSAGASFGPSDVKLVHWYVFDMPVSTLNTALCSGGELGMSTFATSSLEAGTIATSPTTASVEIGEFTRQTGVIAFYDTAAADGAEIWPRAGAVFTFSDEITSNEIVVAGRGDVYTAP